MSRFSKWFEVIGLGMILFSAFLEFQANSKLAEIDNYNIVTTHKEIEYNRQKIMQLILCMEDKSCEDWDKEHLTAETWAYKGFYVEERYTELEKSRFWWLIIGSFFLICSRIASFDSQNKKTPNLETTQRPPTS